MENLSPPKQEHKGLHCKDGNLKHSSTPEIRVAEENG